MTALQRFALVVALAAVVEGCAITRPQVKSLSDQAAANIQFDAPIVTTVKALNEMSSHCGPARDHRTRPEEFRVYEVVGRIVHASREGDRDIHVVLEDLEDQRARVITESDDPNFRANTTSPYRAKLGDARKMLDDLLRESGGQDWKSLEGLTVRMTGVGFFDMNHLQVGRSRSCIELHPILTIERVGGRPSTDRPEVRETTGFTITGAGPGGETGRQTTKSSCRVTSRASQRVPPSRNLRPSA